MTSECYYMLATEALFKKFDVGHTCVRCFLFANCLKAERTSKAGMKARNKSKAHLAGNKTWIPCILHCAFGIAACDS